MKENKLILLSGYPNTGKTTIFNLLTKKYKYTNNLCGRKLNTKIGKIKNNKEYIIVDLPGVYSLLSMNDEEVLTRDTILFDNAYKNVIVVDSCFLERNLNLVLQMLEINKKIILCLNFIDELDSKNIEIDKEKLSTLLDLPVIMCSAKNKIGIDDLINNFDVEKSSSYSINYGKKVEEILNKFIPLIGLDAIYNINKRFIALKLLEGDKSIVKSIYIRYGVDILSKEVNEFLRDINFEEMRRIIAIEVNNESKRISLEVIKYLNKDINQTSRKIDKIITSKRWGIPLFLLIFTIILYLTIVLTSYFSQFLNFIFHFIENKLYEIFIYLKVVKYIYNPLLFSIFKSVGYIISIMLLPMVIFFALFSLGEECGFLSRIAFNFDKMFKCFKSHGKHALTTCMGFGCNACSVIQTRMIDSPRDKIIAAITNNFIPCSGKLPMLISIITIFFVSEKNSNILVALILITLMTFGILISLIVSKILATTLLKGVTSYFTLELSPYRKPNIINVIKRSVMDKTFFILKRVIKVALLGGLVIWLFANINISNLSLLNHISNFLDPFAKLIGLDGFILFAFILALPATEMVLPLILMGYLSTKTTNEISNIIELKKVLVNNGWDIIKAISVCLFSLMHFPCMTTLITIKKEIGLKWSIISFIIPTAIGISILFVFNLII